MPQRLRAQIHEFLHDYKKRVFELEHDDALAKERRDQVQTYVHDLLNQKFHYHFHEKTEKVDQERAEALQLIHHYCTEALLPPILDRIAQREALIEQRHAAALEILEKVLETFAQEVDEQAAR